MTSIVTAATSDGTNRYRTRFAHVAPDHFRSRYGLWLSSIGLGTYLGGTDPQTNDAYVESIEQAIRQGCNVIDTAINYRLMASERAVGCALKKLFASGEFQRDEVVICSKGGFIPYDSHAPADPAAYLQEKLIVPGLATADEIVDGIHCIAPDYLSNQIGISLANLGLETLDVYYLHNPETQLARVSPTEFMDRLRRAFARMEEEVTRGRIRFYGVATWGGFRAEEHDRQYLPLFMLAKVAQEVGGAQHHFRFIQFPYSLTMPEAFTQRNQVVERRDAAGQPNQIRAPLLAAAVQQGIAAMISAPLHQTQVIGRVPTSIKSALAPVENDAQVALQFVRSTPGVTTALVGMRQVEHVIENLALAPVDPMPQTEFLKRFVRRS
jgi:aryl-alcohol dehydrogenase-like predicted oxidoreductase